MIKNKPISPKKAQIVGRILKGMDAEKADAMLSFMKQKAAKYIRECLRNAIYIAEQRGQRIDGLFIKSVWVGRAFILKKPEYRARGRVNIRRRAYSNIRINLIGIKERGK